jgi:hypothetical protein
MHPNYFLGGPQLSHVCLSEKSNMLGEHENEAFVE